ncbi:MAG: cyclic nucleotide-binding domain-containing protein [Deltaproteobacteria bacterium]|nr:cyclic nucleotide-binding domain-containing protein [Deltaproteobacteria bacterium]
MARMSEAGYDSVREWLWKGDKVRGAWAAGTLLKAEPGDLHALALCGWALLELESKAEGGRALRSCAEAATERGDLPLALSCMFALSESGEAVGDLLESIVRDYHRGSPRVDPALHLAPPLPRELPDAPARPEAGEVLALVQRAVKAAQDRLAFDRSMEVEPPALPAIPLLGTLSADNLRRVLAAAEAVRVAPGELLVEQGTEGDAVYLVLCGWAQVVRRTRGGEEQALRRVGPGGVVGEVALVTRAGRVASVRSETGLMALRLARDVIEAIAAGESSLADELVEFCRQRMIANLLETSPLFAGWAEAERAQVLEAFDRRMLRAGDEPVEQGKPSPGLFLIVAGKAEVLRREGKGKKGQLVRLAELGPADVFGEMSLVVERAATATVRMVYDSAVLTLPRGRFLRVAEAHPELLEELRRVAREREEETRSLLGQPSTAADDLTIV